MGLLSGERWADDSERGVRDRSLEEVKVGSEGGERRV